MTQQPSESSLATIFLCCVSTGSFIYFLHAALIHDWPTSTFTSPANFNPTCRLRRASPQGR